MLKPSLQFENLNGARIKVGVADSGIDSSHPALEQCVNKSVSFLDTNILQGCGTTIPTPTPTDMIGHGTAIAYIIHKKAPAAQIYNIKILDECLTSSIHKMIDAIDWAIEQNLDVINLSLGSTQFRYKNEVEAAIHRAHAANLLIVSACNRRSRPSLPASLPGVFGVSGGTLRGKYSYYWEEESRKFIARGDHQRVAGAKRMYYFGFGSSYAAPHITGIVTLIRQFMPGATYSEVLDCLISNSLTSNPDNAEEQQYVPSDSPHNIHEILLKAQRKINSESMSTGTDILFDLVKTIVADTLVLTDEDSQQLCSTTLFDPRFNLNRDVAMNIVEALQDKIDLRIDDEDLFLDDLYSLSSLVAAVKRWQKPSIH